MQLRLCIHPPTHIQETCRIWIVLLRSDSEPYIIVCCLYLIQARALGPVVVVVRESNPSFPA